MGRERVTQRVRAGALGDVGPPHRAPDLALEDGLVEVVPPTTPRPGREGMPAGPLLDHLVGTEQERRGNRKADGLGPNGRVSREPSGAAEASQRCYHPQGSWTAGRAGCNGTWLVALSLFRTSHTTVQRHTRRKSICL